MALYNENHPLQQFSDYFHRQELQPALYLLMGKYLFHLPLPLSSKNLTTPGFLFAERYDKKLIYV